MLFFRNMRIKLDKIKIFSMYFLPFSFFFFVRWLAVQFGNVSVEQVLYHMSESPAGLMESDSRLLVRFAIQVILLSALFSLFFSVIHEKIKKFKPHWVVLLVSFVFFIQSLSVFQYVIGYFGEDYFLKNYISPQTVRVVPRENTKNLLLIYVESLESGYGDANLFGENLLKSFDPFKSISTSFPRLIQMPGTGWTIAGMVSSQCGLPLKHVSFLGGSEHKQSVKNFLPGATCLGDLLKDHGYENVFMGGASLVFAGKGRFLDSHGYDGSFGKSDWLTSGYTEKHMNSWGLHDDHLISEAKKKLATLMAQKKKFNLTLLTSDTHHPDGFYSDTCKKENNPGFPKLVECTANQIARLVEFVRENGWMDDLNIVIMGDHLVMENPVMDQLEEDPNRGVFNLFISKEKRIASRQSITHFDMFPSILDFIGFDVQGGKLGLGRSGFALEDSNDQSQRFSRMSQNLMNYSRSYSDLWTIVSEK
jgi:phosphoglycerol transferase